MSVPTIDTPTANLLGHWTLLSNDVEFRDSGRKEPMFGRAARGHLVFLPAGRVIVFVEALQRIAPSSPEDYRAAHCTMCAYTGTYRIEGDQWITCVDSSWNVVWTGTQQLRQFEISGNTLSVTSAWYCSPLHNDVWVRAHLVWERQPPP